MKIDEPKTPYAKHYDPAEDEDDVPTLDAGDLLVDELDRKNERRKEDEIPGLELGEPEEAVPQHEFGDEGRIVRSGSIRSEPKSVVVDPAAEEAGHGEEASWSKEEKEKHRQFEERRKRHYEMKDVRGLLGYDSCGIRIFSIFYPQPPLQRRVRPEAFTTFYVTKLTTCSHPEMVDDIMDEDTDSPSGPSLPMHTAPIVNGL